MKSRIAFNRCFGVIALISACLFGPAGFAQPPFVPHIETGLFGVAPGQLARLNAINVGDVGTDPLVIDIQFVDVSGTVLASDERRIGPGEGASFDLRSPIDRVEVRTLVNLATTGDISAVKATVEVFDGDTGKTAVFLKADAVGLQ